MPGFQVAEGRAAITSMPAETDADGGPAPPVHHLVQEDHGADGDEDRPVNPSAAMVVASGSAIPTPRTHSP